MRWSAIGQEISEALSKAWKEKAQALPPPASPRGAQNAGAPAAASSSPSSQERSSEAASGASSPASAYGDPEPTYVHVPSHRKARWLALLPDEARGGKSGAVLVRLAVDHDGKLSAGREIVKSSGNGALDHAAVPFPAAPLESSDSPLQLQLVFACNESSSEALGAISGAPYCHAGQPGSLLHLRDVVR